MRVEEECIMLVTDLYFFVRQVSGCSEKSSGSSTIGLGVPGGPHLSEICGYRSALQASLRVHVPE